MTVNASILLNGDLEVSSDNTIEGHLNLAGGITPASAEETRTMTTIPSIVTPVDGSHQRITLNGDVDGNVAVIHGSGNFLPLRYFKWVRRVRC